MSGPGRSGAVSAGQEHAIAINLCGYAQIPCAVMQQGKAAFGRGVGQSRLPAEILLAVFFGKGSFSNKCI